MKKLFLSLGLLFSTATLWGSNAYMVENIPGTNNCYDFQTTPTCSATIQGFSGGGASTFSYITASTITIGSVRMQSVFDNTDGIPVEKLQFYPLIDQRHIIQFIDHGLNTRLTYDSLNGRWGINTTAPSRPLEVNGDAEIDGTAYIDTYIHGPHQPQSVVNIIPPAQGALLYNTDVGAEQVGDGGHWNTLVTTSTQSGGATNIQNFNSIAVDSTTSESFVAAQSYQVTITPTKSTSLVRLDVTLTYFNDVPGRVFFSILNNGAELTNQSNGMYAAVSAATITSASYSWIDSPATTSPITYTIAYRSGPDGGTTTLGDSNTVTSITATEIPQ